MNYNELKKSSAYCFSNMQCQLSALVNSYQKEKGLTDKEMAKFLEMPQRKYKDVKGSDFDGSLYDAYKIVHKVSDKTLKISEIS